MTRRPHLRGWSATALTLLVYMVLSVATTWPLALDPVTAIVTRHFDGFSAIWLMDVAPDLDAEMRSGRAGWPDGQVLRRADSQLMVLAGRLLSPLLGPVLLFNLFVLLGPVLSAWAAEAFARRTLGAERPWSVLAGLSFAFCGMSATSILEGHAYFLLLPWMPLLAMTWWAATGPTGRLRDGFGAGATWALCLLTSGYMGILGAVLVLVGAPRALAAPRSRWRPVAAAAAIAVPVGLIYTLGFVTGADEAARFHTDAPALGMAADAGLGATASQLQSGSSGLLQLVGLRLADDNARHSIAPVLSMTALVLALFAGRVLPRGGGWRAFQVLGIVGAALSLGPMIETIDGPLYSMPALERLLVGGAPTPGGPGGPGVPSGPPWPGFPNLPGLLFPLAWLDGDVFFHFPYRFAWLAALGFGGVAAAVTTRLAHQLGPRRWMLWGLLLAGLWDATGRPMVPLRSALVPLEVPDAYGRIRDWDGAVLEVWARPAGGATDADLRMNNLTCTYQRVHRRPMASDCIGTGLDASPRVRATHWLTGKALEFGAGEPIEPSSIRQSLANLGIGAVAVHPLLFAPDDGQALTDLLRLALGPPEVSSTRGGDPVRIYRVPDPATRDAARPAWRALE